MKFRYKPEDLFVNPIEIYGWLNIKEERKVIALTDAITHRVNQLLEAHEKTLPRVYGTSERPQIWTSYQVSEQLNGGSTHTTLLYGIEEIKAASESLDGKIA